MSPEDLSEADREIAQDALARIYLAREARLEWDRHYVRCPESGLPRPRRRYDKQVTHRGDGAVFGPSMISVIRALQQGDPGYLLRWRDGIVKLSCWFDSEPEAAQVCALMKQGHSFEDALRQTPATERASAPA